MISHPSDGEAWKHFDSTYPNFAYDLEMFGLDYVLMGSLLTISQVLHILVGL